MSVTITVSDEVIRHLQDLDFVDTDDVEAKLQQLLIAEYQRRLARYRLTDRRLREKYGMGFEEFERQRITKKQGYTWQVESDAMAWETAVDGIETLQRQLADIGAPHDDH